VADLGVRSIYNSNAKLNAFEYGGYIISNNSFNYGNKFGDSIYDIPLIILFQKLLYVYYIHFIRLANGSYINDEYKQIIGDIYDLKNFPEEKLSMQRKLREKYLRQAIELNMSANLLATMPELISKLGKPKSDEYILEKDKEEKLRNELKTEINFTKNHIEIKDANATINFVENIEKVKKLFKK